MRTAVYACVRIGTVSPSISLVLPLAFRSFTRATPLFNEPSLPATRERLLSLKRNIALRPTIVPQGVCFVARGESTPIFFLRCPHCRVALAPKERLRLERNVPRLFSFFDGKLERFLARDRVRVDWKTLDRRGSRDARYLQLSSAAFRTVKTIDTVGESQWRDDDSRRIDK